MLRVVLDTNIFVSHLIVKAGIPDQLFNAWRAQRFVLVTSPAIIAEIRATAAYPRIQRKYSLTTNDIEDLTSLLQSDAVVVEGKADVSGAIPDDPDDEEVLACAVGGRADLIISGDHHLLALGQYRDIRILTPAQFLDRLNTMES
jgi:putative PIN family toxin of toxin-antitoxin system